MGTTNQHFYETSLVSISLKKINCESYIASSEISSGKVLSTISVSLTYDDDILNIDDNFTLALDANIKAIDNETNKDAFSFSCLYVGEFTLLKAPFKEVCQVESYLAYLASNQLYPYVIRYATDFMNSMGYNDIALPLTIAYDTFVNSAPKKRKTK